MFNYIYNLIEANLGVHYTTKKINKICSEQAINFANWVQIDGWSYGIDGKYYKDKHSMVTNCECTPQQLYEIFVEEVQPKDKNDKNKYYDKQK